MLRRCRVLAGLFLLLECSCALPGPSGATPVPPPSALTGQQPQSAPTAPSKGPFDETFGLRAGGMLAAAFRTEASLGVDGAGNRTVNFEDELGIADNASSFRADMYWRISRHHRIDLGYFDLDRTGSRNIDRQIQWGDLNFDVGVEVSSELRTKVLPLRYTYYLVAEDDHELGFGLGIYSMGLTASLGGMATAGGATVAALATETFETPVPLPVFGVQGSWALTDDLVAQASLQAFYLELQDIGSTDRIDGYLLDLLLGLDWRMTDNIGLGLAANWFQMNAGATRDRLDFDFDYGFAGVFAFLSMRI